MTPISNQICESKMTGYKKIVYGTVPTLMAEPDNSHIYNYAVRR